MANSRENGAERIYTALVKVGLCHLECFKVTYRSKWTVSSQNMAEIQTPYNMKTMKNNKLIK